MPLPPKLTSFELVETMDDAALGAIVKELVRLICPEPKEMAAVTTAAACTLVGAANLLGRPEGSIDLKGIRNAQGQPLGDYRVHLSRLSEEAFPSAPPRLELPFRRKALPCGLTAAELGRLALHVGAGKLQQAACRAESSDDEAVIAIWEALQPVLMERVVPMLLRRAQRKSCPLSLEDAIHQIRAELSS